MSEGVTEDVGVGVRVEVNVDVDEIKETGEPLIVVVGVSVGVIVGVLVGVEEEP